MCGSKNEFHKDTSLKEIGLHAQNMIAIMDSIANIIDGDASSEHEDLNFDNE